MAHTYIRKTVFVNYAKDNNIQIISKRKTPTREEYIRQINIWTFEKRELMQRFHRACVLQNISDLKDCIESEYFEHDFPFREIFPPSFNITTLTSNTSYTPQSYVKCCKTINYLLDQNFKPTYGFMICMCHTKFEKREEVNEFMLALRRVLRFFPGKHGFRNCPVSSVVLSAFSKYDLIKYKEQLKYFIFIRDLRTVKKIVKKKRLNLYWYDIFVHNKPYSKEYDVKITEIIAKDIIERIIVYGKFLEESFGDVDPLFLNYFKKRVLEPIFSKTATL